MNTASKVTLVPCVLAIVAALSLALGMFGRPPPPPEKKPEHGPAHT